ncbi:MAG: hypothetical protein K0U86_10280 [Planctomycetes bacterium]|nr:hypothetical protein [Planctomycetota bacterium]MCH9725278.1 hypothetical protein [Planctomycetota bacterium]MCH9779502.1 hypothetical protein [Planctomycetota bacterium]MCH9792639.1 hypothetical protein [Planctomycetota bacterium]
MNSGKQEVDHVIKEIESVAPDGYGRMPIPSQTDSDLYEQIQTALQTESVSDFLLNQRGIDSLFKFVERMATQCLRESEFLHCGHAAQAMEIVLSQPDYDEKMVLVGLALIHDAYERLQIPRPEFDSKQMPRFCEAWTRFRARLAHEKTISSIKYRIGTEHDGPRYICYW